MPIERIYILYSENIYQFIYFLVGDEELAKDLTQETFMKAMNSLSQFRGQASERTWLTKIARNLVYDHFRRKKLLKFIPLLKEHEQIDYTYSPERWLHAKTEQFELYEALGKLPHNYREAIVLRKIEQFSIKESAQILGWTEAKVKNSTERGMRKMNELLGGERDA
ncbi:RNA polymerase sigma factor [Solibacillus silvestris]|uniref:RNA polymerase sigma factor n=1 Tax=Solibacillus silvestris TaxID=76853 RepID=UPI003F7F2964